MSKARFVNDVCIVETHGGRTLFASKYVTLAELLEVIDNNGVKTLICNKPSSKVRRWLESGYVVAMLEDDCSHCTVFKLSESE
jgi:hypothetical protein